MNKNCLDVSSRKEENILLVSIYDYTTPQELKKFLKSLPPPPFERPPEQTHFPLGGSNFYICPFFDSSYNDPFPAIRGSIFHHYYNPKICNKFIPAHSILERLYKIELKYAYRYNSRNVSLDITFGGSPDIYIPRLNWLIDVKYTTKKNVDHYFMQLNGYKLLIEEGMFFLGGNWNKSTGKVKHMSILAIHPETFENYEVEVPSYGNEFVKMVIIETELAKKGVVIPDRRGYHCYFCKNRKKCEVFKIYGKMATWRDR